ncbi:MAG: hypothetical protein PHS44_04190 [Candidatus Dojkabacteria bacterium]|nr:hypothetical protein [Candidatus Dojkabacteria bacterium]
MLEKSVMVFRQLEGRGSLKLLVLFCVLICIAATVYLASRKETVDTRRQASEGGFDFNEYRGFARIGAGRAPDMFPMKEQEEEWDDYKFGWYHTWRLKKGFSYEFSKYAMEAINPTAKIPPNVVFHGMIGSWVFEGGQDPDCTEKVKEKLAEYEDGEVIWVGNELGWGDGRDPHTFAVQYNGWYDCIKSVNPNIKVSPGANPGDPYFFKYQVRHGEEVENTNFIGYLTFAREEYQMIFGTEMPVDAYVIHTYIFHTADDYEAYSRDLEVSVRRFREFMKSIGDQDKPLIVKEMGNLTAIENGDWTTSIEELERSYALFLNLKDGTIGNPLDNNRLVQQWSWFVGENLGFDECWDAVCDWCYTSFMFCKKVPELENWVDTFDCKTNEVTPLGLRYKQLVADIGQTYDDSQPIVNNLSLEEKENSFEVSFNVRDEESQVNNIEISIGTVKGKADIVHWKSIGKRNTYTISEKHKNKFFNVKVIDDGYNWSNVVSEQIQSSCIPECSGKQCGQDNGCGGKCTNCPEEKYCDTDSWQCKSGGQGECVVADIWGAGGEADGEVSGYDMSFMLSNWKCNAGEKCKKADIWGKESKKDGKVDSYDLSKLLGCWKQE